MLLAFARAGGPLSQSDATCCCGVVGDRSEALMPIMLLVALSGIAAGPRAFASRSAVAPLGGLPLRSEAIDVMPEDAIFGAL